MFSGFLGGPNQSYPGTFPQILTHCSQKSAHPACNSTCPPRVGPRARVAQRGRFLGLGCSSGIPLCAPPPPSPPQGIPEPQLCCLPQILKQVPGFLPCSLLSLRALSTSPDPPQQPYSKEPDLLYWPIIALLDNPSGLGCPFLPPTPHLRTLCPSPPPRYSLRSTGT